MIQTISAMLISSKAHPGYRKFSFILIKIKHLQIEKASSQKRDLVTLRYCVLASSVPNPFSRPS